MILPPGAEADKRGGEGVSGGNKKPALDERGRENVSITGEVMWSTNSMTAKQEEGSTGIYSGIVPEHLLIENEEPDIRVD